MENANFSMFLHVFWAVPLNTKNGEEGHPRLFSRFFGRIQKRCHASSKMMKRGTPRLFSRFWAHSKAVSLNTKNGEEGHRAFFCHFCGALKSGATLRQK